MSVDCRYLGLFAKEVDAAQAYDRESVSRKGLKAITNFDICEYLDLLSMALLSVSPPQIDFIFAYLLRRRLPNFPYLPSPPSICHMPTCIAALEREPPPKRCTISSTMFCNLQIN